MFCKNCGNSLDDNNQVCYKCGTNNNLQLNNLEHDSEREQSITFIDKLQKYSLLSNRMICKLFSILLVLQFVIFLFDLKILFNGPISGSVSGWLFMILPVYLLYVLYPPYFGYKITKKNLMELQNKSLIIILIFSLIGLYKTITPLVALFGAINLINSEELAISIIMIVIESVSFFINAILTLFIILKLKYKIKE